MTATRLYACLYVYAHVCVRVRPNKRWNVQTNEERTHSRAIKRWVENHSQSPHWWCHRSKHSTSWHNYTMYSPYVCIGRLLSQTNESNAMCETRHRSSAVLRYTIFMGANCCSTKHIQIWVQRHLRAYIKRKRKIWMTEMTWTRLSVYWCHT